MLSQSFSVKAIASLLSVLSVANAHMIMKSPIPYGRGSINNSPLANDGSDFPCKNIFDMTDPVNDVNYLTQGVASTLSFTGSAVHGGGSCQVSLTTDLKPTKSSKWMVIKSIEGGCPADVSGNLPADPNGNGASTFQYTVPEGFPDGEYTIAWTWFNKVGNREMYMNCGRASIGAKKKRYAPAKPKVIETRDTTYPDLFTANLDIFQCKVPDNMNVIFPNPGSSVQTVGNVNDKSIFTPPTGCGASASSGGNSPDTGSGSSSAASPAATTPAPSAASSANSPMGTSGGSPGVFASGAASATSSAPAAATNSATATAPSSPDTPSQSSAASASVSPMPASPSSPSSPPSSGSPSGSTTQGSACSDEGAYMCSADGSSFQRCASGTWSAPIQMAAGTKCTAGQSTDLGEKVVTGSGKRDLVSTVNERRSSFHQRRALLFSS